MGGEVTGLDLAEAVRSLPRGLPREFVRTLLIGAETAFLVGWHKRSDKD